MVFINCCLSLGYNSHYEVLTSCGNNELISRPKKCHMMCTNKFHYPLQRLFKNTSKCNSPHSDSDESLTYSINPAFSGPFDEHQLDSPTKFCLDLEKYKHIRRTKQGVQGRVSIPVLCL